VNLWTLLVGKVFSICIKQKHTWWNVHSNCRWFYRELMIMSLVSSMGAI